MGCNPVLVAGSVTVKEDVRRAVRAASHHIGGIINMSMVLNVRSPIQISFLVRVSSYELD